MRALRVRELALGLGAALLALLLAEAAARWLLEPPRTHRGFPFVEFDGDLGQRGVASYRDEVSTAAGTIAFALGPEGFRGPPLPGTDTAPGKRRVAFFGDSFLVGRSLAEPDLMTSKLSAMLVERGAAAEVYNLSVIDYGTGQELLLLERWAPRLRPNAVVLALYPGNDVANDAIELAGRTRVSPGDLIRPYVTPEGDALRVRFATPARAWMRRHSRLFAVLEQRAIALFPSLGLRDRGATRAQRLRLGNAPFEHLELFRRHDPAHRWEVAWRRTEELLRAFQERCRGMGAELLVLVIPTAEQVERTYRSVELDIATRRHAGHALDDLVDWNLPERRLARFLRDERIDTRFLLNPLREAALSSSKVYTQDGHLGAIGHAIAARVVADWLLGEPEQGSPIAGAPTRRLRDADAVAPTLDFRVDDQRDPLGGGWLFWRAESEGEPWGWWTAPEAEIALPAAPGDLVLRGWLPSDARVPALLRVGEDDGHEARITATGPFEVRVPIAATALGVSSEGYVSLRWRVDETHRYHDMPIGLIVHEIGFEERKAAP